MATLTFDGSDSVCALPPFNPVSNRLFFFRVNAFEVDLPLSAQSTRGDPGTTLVDVPRDLARLGVPITDLFPNLMPEYSPSLHELNRVRARVDRGVFLPASTANRHFDAGQLASASATDLAQGSINIGSTRITLSPSAVAELNAGRPVTVMRDRLVIRVLPPVPTVTQTDIAPTQQPSRFVGFAVHLSGVTSLMTRPDQLSEAQYNELCDLLFENIPSPNLPWLASLSRRERAILKNLCRRDPRFAAWDNTRPGKYGLEPPHYEIGFVSEYEQCWDLVGFSRGALVSSITLAPEEELTIEVFTWDRSKLEREDEQSTETERSVESSALARVSAQVNNDLTETTDKRANFGLGATLPVEGIPIKADGQTSISDVLTQSIQSTVNTISETTRKASERFKTTTQVKVVQSRETGTETRVTRKIRNPNQGRTLTMHCFEVMEHYKVATRLVRAEKFVLLAEVPHPKSFDIRFVLANEEKLQRALLGPNFLAGFEAAKKLLAQQFFDDRSRIKAEIEAAQAKARADAAAPSDDPPIVLVARQMRDKLRTVISLDLIQEIGTLANSYLPGNKISEKERAEANDALGIFNFWLKFKLVTPGIDSKASSYVHDVPSAPTSKQAYEGLMAFTAGLDDEWLTTIKMLAASVVAANLALTIIPAFAWLSPVLLELALLDNNLGLPSLIDKAKQLVRAYEATLQPPPPPAGTGDTAQTKAFAPPQLFTLQELALADAEFKKLQLHLEANRVFYLNSLFAQLDVNVRYETLKVLGIHNIVENRLLGFVGSRAVFPLRLATLETEAQQYLRDILIKDLPELLKANVAVTNEEDVVLPTNGLHMEAVVGSCDALEPFLLQSRLIEQQAASARANLAKASAKQVAIENDRRQKRLDEGNLDPPLG
jgi:hypothetical protein